MESKVRERLKQVLDPEIGYDIISLGLVYDIKVSGKKARVRMTLTTPLCPYGPVLVADVERAIREIGLEPEIEVVFDPPWSIDMVDKKIRDDLGL